MSTFRRIAAAAAFAALALSTTAAAADYPCFHADEQRSARIHDFQILMMVGTLQCRDVAPGSVGRYGAMLAQRDGEMAAHGDRLLGRMIDEWGYREGRRTFDTYETALSNEYAKRRLTREACEDLGAFARMALEASPAELETLSRLASRREVALCEAGGTAGSVRMIPPRVEGGASAREHGVRVFRGMVPPQATATEFPPIVSAPVAEPRIAEDAELAAEAVDEAALAAAEAVSGADRLDDAGTLAEAPAAETVAFGEAENAAPSSTRLDAAISALNDAANALRDLRDEQGKPQAK